MRIARLIAVLIDRFPYISWGILYHYSARSWPHSLVQTNFFITLLLFFLHFQAAGSPSFRIPQFAFRSLFNTMGWGVLQDSLTPSPPGTYILGTSSGSG